MAGDGQVVFTVEMDDAAFQAGLTRLQESLTLLGQSAASALALGTEAAAEALLTGKQWVDRLAVGIQGNHSATTAARAAVTTATNAARTLGYSNGYGVGKNIVAGMAVGAQGSGGLLSAAIVRIVQSALAAAKRAAGIRSPSTLFRDEVGQYLALGVQTGFESTMQNAVLPAIGRSVAQSATTGQRALQNTLLGSIQSALPLSVALPEPSGISAAAASGVSAGLGGSGVQAASIGAQVVNVTQQITFETAMQAPDEVARAIRKQAAYGLAGARM